MAVALTTHRDMRVTVALRSLVGATTTLVCCWSIAVVHAQPRIGIEFPFPGRSQQNVGTESHLRIAVEPRTASVYVDGYLAGTVDEFDGTFQRLHVVPGRHELVVYLEGYHSLRQQLYLSPNATRKITGSLEKLPVGEPNDPIPQPSEVDPTAQIPEPERPQSRRGNGPVPPPPARPAETTGSLSIRVQPSGADVLVDGEHWAGTEEDERLVVQVSDGRHVIEIRKNGFRGFVTEVEVHHGETLPLNVSLMPNKE